MPDRPIPEKPSIEVRWESDGSYTPICHACPWEGKRRDQRHVAAASCRHHSTSKTHRRAYIAWERKVRL
jgi:hypothetical protein